MIITTKNARFNEKINYFDHTEEKYCADKIIIKKNKIHYSVITI